jgi:SAM-dependent methyltransferase
MWHGEFQHPRLASVYDQRFAWSGADDFFFDFANRSPRARVVDLGCGTGRLTLALAAAGHDVTGVDPATASLEAARAKAGAETVRWVDGTSVVLGEATFDVALMTSHVAQFLVDDADWHATLSSLHRALVPGGRLAFDTRDPDARAWQQWDTLGRRHRVPLDDGSNVQVWATTTAVSGEVVTGTEHYLFDDGEELTSRASLRFRQERSVRDALHEAGFRVSAIYGGWNKEPVGRGDGELIVLADRP